MIPRIQNWARSERGDFVIFTHPRGEADGVIRYCERVRPVRTLEEQLAIVVPAFRDASTSAIVELTTHEGEAAAMVTVRATCEGAPFALVIGTVFGDDFQSTLSATTTVTTSVDDLERLVRSALAHDALALGVRRRAARHVGPMGWTRETHGFVTEWIAPSQDAVIRVAPCEPHTTHDPLAMFVAVALEEGRVFDAADGPYDLPSAGGETWSAWRLTGRNADRELLCDVAILHDAHYDYAVTLESLHELAHARYRDAFTAVLASVKPRASIRCSSDAVLAASAHWAL